MTNPAPVKLRIRGGQLQQWDDDPPEEFGQIWISVCAWCHRGPLNTGEVVCGECPAEVADNA
jgi:hypothetical protein